MSALPKGWLYRCSLLRLNIHHNLYPNIYGPSSTNCLLVMNLDSSTLLEPRLHLANSVLLPASVEALSAKINGAHTRPAFEASGAQICSPEQAAGCVLPISLNAPDIRNAPSCEPSSS